MYRKPFYIIFTLLNINIYNDCMIWNNDGSSIIILDENNFVEKVLIPHTSFSSIASFDRMLKRYNFSSYLVPLNSKKYFRLYYHCHFNIYNPTLSGIKYVNKRKINPKYKIEYIIN